MIEEIALDENDIAWFLEVVREQNRKVTGVRVMIPSEVTLEPDEEEWFCEALFDRIGINFLATGEHIYGGYIGCIGTLKSALREVIRELNRMQNTEHYGVHAQVLESLHATSSP